MKTKLKWMAVIFIINIASCMLPQKAIAQHMAVNFQVFYDELSPYGNWIENPEYGYVWIPDVEPGFSPYSTNGYWVYTEYGWTWVSDYAWGWAPFHYGRWYTDPYYGPMWIPDNEWGPGWVSWRRSADYYGWAPMGPGISISMAFGSSYHEHYNNYTFVGNRYFGRRDMHSYYTSSTNNITIINNTTVINNSRVNQSRNTTYNAGPERTEVEKRRGKKITPFTIKESNKPGQKISKSQLQLYRPNVGKDNTVGKRNAPSKVVNIKELKTTEQRMKDAPSQKSNNAVKQQRNVQPAKQQPVQQQQRIDKSVKQQPTQQQQQRIDRPAKQQPIQQQRIDRPVKQQPAQQQQQQRIDRPVKQQPVQQQRNIQPTQQQRIERPVQKQPTQQQQLKPVEKKKEEKRGR